MKCNEQNVDEQAVSNEYNFTTKVVGVLAEDALDYMMNMNAVLRRFHSGFIEIWMPQGNECTVEYVTNNISEVEEFEKIKDIIHVLTMRYIELKYKN
jgi:hypothetical protein